MKLPFISVSILSAAFTFATVGGELIRSPDGVGGRNLLSDQCMNETFSKNPEADAAYSAALKKQNETCPGFIVQEWNETDSKLYITSNMTGCDTSEMEAMCVDIGQQAVWFPQFVATCNFMMPTPVGDGSNDTVSIPVTGIFTTVRLVDCFGMSCPSDTNGHTKADLERGVARSVGGNCTVDSDSIIYPLVMSEQEGTSAAMGARAARATVTLIGLVFATMILA